MTVWIYVDTIKQIGDKDHLKVFADQDALLPTQSRDEVEAKIAAAEDALQKANVELTKG